MNGFKTLKIALKGWGVAGQARFQAIENIQFIQCSGVVSRRPEFANLTWEQALSDPQIEAIAISTENTDHSRSVQQALESGKHVLCDYPLALKYQEAKSLFELAAQKQKVLHVEHIGLLTQAHQDLKKQTQNLGIIKKGEYLFQGGWNEKLANPAYAGPPNMFALSRLLQVADLLGQFEIKVREYQVHDQGFRLHLHLHFLQGGVLGFTEERRVGLHRRRSLQIQLTDGNIHWKPSLKKENLFGQDLEFFYKRVKEGGGCYYDEGVMVELLRELERIG